jgi:hypothetical protein
MSDPRNDASHPNINPAPQAFEQPHAGITLEAYADLSFADRQLEQRRRELMGLPPMPEPPAPRSILARLGLALTGGMRPRRA